METTERPVAAPIEKLKEIERQEKEEAAKLRASLEKEQTLKKQVELQEEQIKRLKDDAKKSSEGLNCLKEKLKGLEEEKEDLLEKLAQAIVDNEIRVSAWTKKLEEGHRANDEYKMANAELNQQLYGAVERLNKERAASEQCNDINIMLSKELNDMREPMEEMLAQNVKYEEANKQLHERLEKKSQKLKEQELELKKKTAENKELRANSSLAPRQEEKRQGLKKAKAHGPRGCKNEDLRVVEEVELMRKLLEEANAEQMQKVSLTSQVLAFKKKLQVSEGVIKGLQSERLETKKVHDAEIQTLQEANKELLEQLELQQLYLSPVPELVKKLDQLKQTTTLIQFAQLRLTPEVESQEGMKSLNNETEALRASCAVLEEKLRNSEERCQSLEETAIATSIKKGEDFAQNMWENYRLNQKDLEEKLIVLEAKVEEEKTLAAAQKKRIDSALEIKQKELLESRKLVEDLRKQIKKLKEEKQNLEKLVSSKGPLEIEYKEALDKLEAQKAELKEKSTKIQGLEDKLKASERAKGGEHKKNSSQLGQLRADCAKLKQELDNLKATHRLTQENWQEDKKACIKAGEENNELKADYDKLKQESDHLKARHRLEQESWQEDKKSYIKDIKAAEEKLKVAADKLLMANQHSEQIRREKTQLVEKLNASGNQLLIIAGRLAQIEIEKREAQVSQELFKRGNRDLQQLLLREKGRTQALENEMMKTKDLISQLMQEKEERRAFEAGLLIANQALQHVVLEKEGAMRNLVAGVASMSIRIPIAIKSNGFHTAKEPLNMPTENTNYLTSQDKRTKGLEPNRCLLMWLLRREVTNVMNRGRAIAKETDTEIIETGLSSQPKKDEDRIYIHLLMEKLVERDDEIKKLRKRSREESPPLEGPLPKKTRIQELEEKLQNEEGNKNIVTSIELAQEMLANKALAEHLAIEKYVSQQTKEELIKLQKEVGKPEYIRPANETVQASIKSRGIEARKRWFQGEHSAKAHSTTKAPSTLLGNTNIRLVVDLLEDRNIMGSSEEEENRCYSVARS